MIDALLTHGLFLFPIKAGAKYPPLVKNWPAEARRSSAPWAITPDANIGVHCVGLCVVDVDPKAGGVASYKHLLEQEGFPTTFTVRTPSGGAHLYYRMPAGQEAQNTVGKIAPGIDTRGRHGYVLGPGSKIAAGEYRIELDEPIAPVPEWLLDRLGRAPEAKRHDIQDVQDATPFIIDLAREWLAKAERSVKGQGGDQAAYRVACKLRDFGVSYQQACDLMRSEAWDYGCGWREGRLEQKPIASAYKYAQGEAGGMVALPADFPAIAGPAPRQPTAALRLKEFAAEEGAPHEYIIKGLLYRNSYVMMFGKPGAGKTFVALDLLYHVAAGKPWQKRKARQGCTLYLAYEGVGGMRKRALALLHQYGNEDVPLYVVAAGYNLREKEGRQALGTLIASLPEKPTFIVFDTFAHALCGGDENSAQDVGAFNTGIKALIDATGACVMVLHHPTKAGGTARGSSALEGAIDSEISIEDRKIIAIKQRDVELGDPFGFKLVPVVIGQDMDGEAVTSCVVIPEKVQAVVQQEKLRGKYLLAWDKLIEKRPDNAPITELEMRQVCEEFLHRKQDWPEVRMRLHRAGLIELLEGGMIRRKMA